MHINLRWKFLALFTGVFIIPLIIVMSLSILQLQKTEREAVTALELLHAKTASKEISNFLAIQFGILNNIELTFEELGDDFELRANVLNKVLFANKDFIDLTFVDSEGIETNRKHRFLAITEDALLDRSLTPEFAAVREKGLYISSSYLDRARPLFDI